MRTLRLVLLFILIIFCLSYFITSSVNKVTAQTTAYTKPIMFGYSDYTGLSSAANVPPFIIWGNALQDGSRYATEVSNLAKLDPNMEKMVAFASWSVMQSKITQAHTGFTNEAEYLKSIGVKWLGYNTETEQDGPGTPTDQLLHALDNDPATNSVVQFATIAQENGFNSVWIPYRGGYPTNPAFSTSNPRPNAEHLWNPTFPEVSEGHELALGYMVQAGLDAVWLQEQNMISQYCVDSRVAAFDNLAQQYQRIINEYSTLTGGRMITFMIQLRASSCKEADNACNLTAYPFQACDQFVDTLASRPNMLYGTGLWTMNDNTNDVHQLIITLRQGSASASASPYPSGSPQTKTSDVNHDGQVNGLDIKLLLDSWGIISSTDAKDIDSNGKINSLDNAFIIGDWNGPIFSSPSVSPSINPSSSPTSTTNFYKPITIHVRNLLNLNTSPPSLKAELVPFKPYQVYAWATDPSIANYDTEINYLEATALNDPQIEKKIIFSSWRTLNSKLSQSGHVQRLKDIGVDGLLYNTEGTMTPTDEMNNLGSTNTATDSASVNSVVKFVKVADEYSGGDFKVIWGPIRVTADSISTAAKQVMVDAGLDGIGLQEQQFISGDNAPAFSGCIADRVAAVNTSASQYRSLAGSQFEVNTQIMSTRCLTGDSYGGTSCGENITYQYQHCDQFALQIQNTINSLAIWASGPDDINQLTAFTSVLRN